MAIFNSYVSLPEGISDIHRIHDLDQWDINIIVIV